MVCAFGVGSGLLVCHEGYDAALGVIDTRSGQEEGHVPGGIEGSGEHRAERDDRGQRAEQEPKKEPADKPFRQLSTAEQDEILEREAAEYKKWSRFAQSDVDRTPGWRREGRQPTDADRAEIEDLAEQSETTSEHLWALSDQHAGKPRSTDDSSTALSDQHDQPTHSSDTSSDTGERSWGENVVTASQAAQDIGLLQKFVDNPPPGLTAEQIDGLRDRIEQLNAVYNEAVDALGGNDQDLEAPSDPITENAEAHEAGIGEGSSRAGSAELTDEVRQSVMNHLNRFAEKNAGVDQPTRGMWRDEQGSWNEVISGSDELSRAADEIVANRGLPPLRVAKDVETKVAAMMKDRGITDLDLVVNKQMCEGPRSCTEVIPRILPVGSELRVEDPSGQREPLRGRTES